MLRNRSGKWVLSKPIFDGVNTVWMCIAALESHENSSNVQRSGHISHPCVSSEYCHFYSETSGHFSHLSFLLQRFSQCRRQVTIQLATDRAKKNRVEEKAVQVGKVKEIAANCHHSYRVRVRSRVRSRGRRGRISQGPCRGGLGRSGPNWSHPLLGEHLTRNCLLAVQPRGNG